MEYKREKDFQQKATYDTFDEIYTSFDLSVREKYDAEQGYPFDYPLRWFNDPSMNKRIAIRRLTCIPTSHVFRIKFKVILAVHDDDKKEEEEEPPSKVIDTSIEITQGDSLIKVLSHMRNTLLSFDNDELHYEFYFEYLPSRNTLQLWVIDANGDTHDFAFLPPDSESGNAELYDFLRFLNQDTNSDNVDKLQELSEVKEFDEVWDRNMIFFHTSFSTSNRKIIGVNGDFYTTPNVLYPPPTNESTFYLRFTTDGKKNILIRHCVFIMQLTFIVNFMKTKIL